jgi:spectinomycin phosphotransferase
MLTAPTDLDTASLVDALAHWNLRAAHLEYLPVGFGSHHWRTGDAFVTVDDLAAGFQAYDDEDETFAALGRAYGTASSLREVGLEFVHAPVIDDEGRSIRRLSERYAVSVTPFVEGTSTSWGAYESKEERRRVAALLGRLHVAGEGTPRDLPRRDELTIPSRSVLMEALATLDAPWESGPYADSARAVLAAAADDLHRRLGAYDEDATRARERTDSWVVTHGEPHRANFIVTSDGLRLVDWDTTRLAPRERDLWLVLDDELTGWDEYAAVVGDVSLDGGTLELYRRWWDLADIAVFTAELRRPHGDDEQSEANFRSLRDSLARPA